jgi:diacylglycerol kinase family enzyme
MIVVISNPRSRLNALRPDRADELRQILGHRGELLAPDGLGALSAAAARAREGGARIVAINGGDGTIAKTLTALVEAYEGEPLPLVVPLSGGTMNTNGRALGARGRPVAQLRRVVDAVDGERPLEVRRRTLLEVDGHYGMLFGVGIIARWLEVYYEGAPPSPLKAAALLARTALSALVRGPLIRRIASPVEVEVDVGGVRFAGARWLAVGAGTSDDVGLGFRPFFRCNDEPGRMHVVGFGCTPTALAGQLLRMRRAKPLLAPGIEEAVGSSLVLRASAPLGYMVDGDFESGGRELVVRTGPHVGFVVP